MSTQLMKMDQDDADKIAQSLMATAEAVTGQFKILRGGYAMAVLMDDGLPTERAMVVDADGQQVAALPFDVSNLVHYALEGVCSCEELSDPDGPRSTSPICPVHGHTVKP